MGRRLCTHHNISVNFPSTMCFGWSTLIELIQTRKWTQLDCYQLEMNSGRSLRRLQAKWQQLQLPQKEAQLPQKEVQLPQKEVQLPQTEEPQWGANPPHSGKRTPQARGGTTGISRPAGRVLDSSMLKVRWWDAFAGCDCCRKLVRSSDRGLPYPDRRGYSKQLNETRGSEGPR